MPQTVTLHDVGRLPLPGDNVAIATRKLVAGTTITTGTDIFTLDFTVLEGHRFAIVPIAAGEQLLSWNLPFGIAARAIQPGGYVINPSTLDALQGRAIDFDLPATPNFTDHIEPYVIDQATFQTADQLTIYPEDRTFLGYRRAGKRGVGTRNMIVLLGTTSRTGSFVKQLEHRLQGLAHDYANVDGVVAVAHTEGGTDAAAGQPNNLDLLLRTLAGFMIHPNVGAVLAVDYGLEPVTNAMLRDYMVEHGYPLDQVPHKFLSLTGSFQANLTQGEKIVRGWLDEVNASPRSAESLAHLKIALQCGGSDAFSGISGNPLASWVAREVIRYGGAANLAETDELIGAEPYVLQKVSNIETAQKYLDAIERFKERVAWHGHSAEGNPSGGNKFRGLYNIVLKSIGAAMKRHPDVRLDHVIDYGELMAQPGYYFMDSPGNDLESIAGQVASGSNMIFFVTGNGSITNFPFVPTIKFVTTSRRYRLLSRDMDVNAGEYLDGTPMDEVGARTLDLTVNVASGEQSVGERAGHAQTQIWRNWQQTDSSQLDTLMQAAKPRGTTISIKVEDTVTTDIDFPAMLAPSGPVADQVGLILPTSLCSGQIAAMIANQFNAQGIGREQGLSRFVALVHTEGCGASSGPSEELHARTMAGYLTHPLVRHCLLLEHGCEKTHNDYMRNQVDELGLDSTQLGWASIQLDGGIEKVTAKVEKWFQERLAAEQTFTYITTGVEGLRLGLLSSGTVSDSVANTLAQLTKTVVAGGGTVVVPENGGLLSHPVYRDALLAVATIMPSVAYGEHIQQAGFHIMETPTEHWVETLVGLAATGVETMIVHVAEHPLQGHPLVPLLQITADESVERHFADDVDLVLSSDAHEWPEQILMRIAEVMGDKYQPKATIQGNIDFQVTRGLLGVSM